MGWADGFRSGTNMARSWIDTYNAAKQREELAAVADAKPEASQGFTPDQGDQLRAAGDSGQYDIAYDEGKGGYTVTPKADPSQVGVVAQQGVTDFLGNRTAGDMAPEQVDAARQRAMAGVVMKTDPVTGARMLQDVQRNARDDTRFAWEANDRTVKEAAQQREQDYIKGRQETFNNSIFGQRNEAYAKQLDEYPTKRAAYDAAIASGNTSATPPPVPVRPNLSVGESLLDHASLLAHDIKFGKADSASLVKFAEMQKQVGDEGYRQALMLAQQGAPLAQVIAQFNASGKFKIDPGAIVSDEMVDRGHGVKSRVISFKGPDGSAQPIDTLGELETLGKADKVFARAAQENAAAVADKNLALRAKEVGIHGATAAATIAHLGAQTGEIKQKTADRKEVADIHAELDAAVASGDKAAENKARSKLMAYTVGSKGTQNMSALEQNANLYLASGKAKTMAEAIELARTKVQSSPKDDYLKLTTGAMPLGQAQLESAMTTLHGADWQAKVRGESGPAGNAPPKAAVDYLKAHPDKKGEFDAKYGKGASAAALKS